MICVPIGAYLAVPVLVERYYSNRQAASKLYLVAAGLAYVSSWFLPSPLINGIDTSLWTHVVGGGVYSGLVWLYLLKSYSRPLPLDLQLISLVALVSLLGVANELVELFIVELTSIDIISSDVWWDLLANTMGALSVWLSYLSISRIS